MTDVASVVTALLLVGIATGLLLTASIFVTNSPQDIENLSEHSAYEGSDDLPQYETFKLDTPETDRRGVPRGNKTRATIQKRCSETGRTDVRNVNGSTSFEFKGTTNSDKGNRYINKYDGNQPDWVLEKGNFSPEDPSSSLYEVTRFPDRYPTKKEVERAWELYNKSYEAAEMRGWFDFNNALEDGYQRFDIVHYINKCYYVNDKNLNPFRPESLIYYPDPKNDDEMILAGYMYLTDGLNKEGKQVAGPLTVWHYHPTKERCFVSMLSRGRDFDDIGCSEDSVTRSRSPEMLHVWFVDHPDGPFGSRMGIADEYLEVQNGSSKPEKLPESEFKEYVES